MTDATFLNRVCGTQDLRKLQWEELTQLGSEMRERLKQVVNARGGHLASNLGVVELTLALHYCFDFLNDRLVWDTSHQSYCHKLLTGRNGQLKGSEWRLSVLLGNQPFRIQWIAIANRISRINWVICSLLSLALSLSTDYPKSPPSVSLTLLN